MSKIIKTPLLISFLIVLIASTSCIKIKSNDNDERIEQIVKAVIEKAHTGNDTIAQFSRKATDDSISTLHPSVLQEYYEYKEEEAMNNVRLTGIIFGTVIGAVIVIAPIFLICYFIYRRRTLRYRIIEKAIDKGVTLPQEFFNEIDTPKRSRLQSALVWIAWGLGIIFFLILADGDEGIGLGIVPIFVGVAKLITYFVEDRKKNNDAK